MPESLFELLCARRRFRKVVDSAQSPPHPDPQHVSAHGCGTERSIPPSTNHLHSLAVC